MIEGGREVISMEDLAANIEDMNKSQDKLPVGGRDRHGGRGYQACGQCIGEEDYIGGEENPELCRCPVSPGQGIEDTSSTAPEEGRTKVTWTFLRTQRRLQWEKDMEWEDGGIDRLVDSREALKEDLQDFSSPMVAIGTDVVNMYPSLDVDKVVDMLEDEVMRTKVEWTNIDYLEASRYLALNWSAEECRTSPLRKILPWRRGKGLVPWVKNVVTKNNGNSPQ